MLATQTNSNLNMERNDRLSKTAESGKGDVYPEANPGYSPRQMRHDQDMFYYNFGPNAISTFSVAHFGVVTTCNMIQHQIVTQNRTYEQINLNIRRWQYVAESYPNVLKTRQSCLMASNSTLQTDQSRVATFCDSGFD